MCAIVLDTGDFREIFCLIFFPLGLSPSLRASLTGRDLHHYIFRYLRRLVAEAAAGGGGGGGGGGLDMETEEERLEKTTNR